MIPGQFRRPSLVACASLAALAVAGCGTTSGTHATASATASPHAVPTATKTSPPPPTAAAGTHYAACKDGDCEVAVSKPVTIRPGGHAGPGTLSVKKVRSVDSYLGKGRIGRPGVRRGDGPALVVAPGAVDVEVGGRNPFVAEAQTLDQRQR